MRHDVVDFRDFYETPLGKIARRYVRRRIREAWPDVRRQAVLGIGYPAPYLRQFVSDAERVIAVMPASQGVARWPLEHEPNRVALAEDNQLPLSDESMDRVLIVHSLEHSEHVRHLLREVWRVVRPSGRVLAVVPNRSGLWARVERTPFGHGHPYATAQLSRLLRMNLFTPLGTKDCLYTPPLRSRWLLRSAPAFERLGGNGLRVGGVLVAEATKQIYVVPPLLAVPARRPAAALPSVD